MPGKADIALRNGLIYIPGAQKAVPGSLAVEGERISYCGPDAGITPFLGPHTETIALRGKMLLPALYDSHIHSIFGGLFIPECDLTGLLSPQEYFDAIAEYAKKYPDKACIRGHGWLPTVFGPNSPHKKQLDEIVSNRPVLLHSADGHSAWANSAMLQISGITREMESPPGGIIVRDEKTGEPSGLLHELGAIDLAASHLPKPEAEEMKTGGQKFMDQMLGFGIACIHDAAAFPDSLEACKTLAGLGKLRIRVNCALFIDPVENIAQIAQLKIQRALYQGKHLRADTVKIFLDGTTEGHTALLLEPYADAPGLTGESLWDREVFLKTVERLDAEKFRVHIHAMGDGAVRLALDAFESAQARNGRRDSRHIISHIELVHQDDVPRFKRLGVIADLQPSWFYKDTYSDSGLETILGKDRFNRRFRMKTLWDSGACVAYGSDWPVGGDYITCNPFESLQIGATRRALCGKPPDYMPEEKMPVAALLDCMTINGAYAAFAENTAGTLEAGKLADITVVDRDLLACPESDLARTKVNMTIVGGKIEYRRDL